MRAAPPIQVLATRFGLWRAGVWSVAGVGAVAALGWATLHTLTRGWPSAAWIVAAGCVAAGAALWLAARLSDVRAFELRWDGRAWHLARPAAPAADPVVGDLQVRIDLGAWLLLRFESDWPARERTCYWLPVQRRGGLETAWHALRCALYSPRPVAASPLDPGAAR